jgi:hypothetical protein
MYRRSLALALLLLLLSCGTEPTIVFARRDVPTHPLGASIALSLSSMTPEDAIKKLGARFRLDSDSIVPLPVPRLVEYDVTYTPWIEGKAIKRYKTKFEPGRPRDNERVRFSTIQVIHVTDPPRADSDRYARSDYAVSVTLTTGVNVELTGGYYGRLDRRSVVEVVAGLMALNPNIAFVRGAKSVYLD